MKAFFAQFIPIALIVNCLIGLWGVDVPSEQLLCWQISGFPRWIFVVGMGVTAFTVFYILLQAVLVAVYRPLKARPGDELPCCTVLIPAFNESSQVCEAINSILNCDYPAEKLEIIAIDDGSSDDTWEWICRSVERSNGRVRGLRQERNGGKKRALCRGIRESSNEIIVTVDSDSILQKDALRKLVIPFAQNERAGGVAGNIRVKNLGAGLMPRMLDVAFVFGCDFMRGAQSVTGMVLCTPGAISAYRRCAVEPLLDTWLEQTFFGAPSTIGEDRALTCLLLRNHWQVVCQNNAVADTEVPDCYSKLCKMLLRWTRGDVRESLLLMDFVVSRWNLRDWKWSVFQLNIFSQIIGVLLPFIYIPCTILTFFVFSHHLLFILYYTFSINAVWSLLPAAVYARRTKLRGVLWAFVYGIFSIIALSWICIYSLLTLKNSGWLTRNAR